MSVALNTPSERQALASQREAQQEELQARLQEELLAQKAVLEQQQAAQQAQLDKERIAVRIQQHNPAVGGLFCSRTCWLRALDYLCVNSNCLCVPRA